MRAARAQFVATIVSSAALAACILDLDSLRRDACTGPSCDASVDQPADGGAKDTGDESSVPDASRASCPSLHGPTPVRVTARSGSFCIDSTEVTAGQYAEFLAAKGKDTSGQAQECTNNTSFAALIAPSSLPPTNAIGGVDWCDALAFCAWSGKALCGGFDGAALPVADRNDPTKSTWFAACSMDGARPVPYGATIQGTACNDENRTSAPAAVGSSATCEGGYPGIFDLVGNVEEWTASCENASDPGGGCLARGGHYSSNASGEIACSTGTVHLEARLSAEPWRGFRCCSRTP
jgi:formylglycine-generating enzyme